jgi:hypothetical protein
VELGKADLLGAKLSGAYLLATDLRGGAYARQTSVAQTSVWRTSAKRTAVVRASAEQTSGRSSVLGRFRRNLNAYLLLLKSCAQPFEPAKLRDRRDPLNLVDINPINLLLFFACAMLGSVGIAIHEPRNGKCPH